MNGTVAEIKKERPIPAIRLLKIERFRGIRRLEWRPHPGLNIIVGPGDTCKSTILDAISTLLSPAPIAFVSEFDYFERDLNAGITIEAVVAIGDATILKLDNFPLPPLQGWLNGHLVDLPDENGAEAVLVCRFTAKDQEVTFEIIGAGDKNTSPFPRVLRQRIGLLRLGLADRNDRDLRLVQGGALDRFMEGQDLRQSVLQVILKTPIHNHLGVEPKKALALIESQFRKKSLPSPVRLGLVGTPGVSLAASVGLMAGKDDDTALPLPSWGTGTRRMASLELASILTSSASLAVVDEPESGLEPYRQRAFVDDLYREGTRQIFVTTHSPAVLTAASDLNAVTWRINPVLDSEVSDKPRPGGADDPLSISRSNGDIESHKLTALLGETICKLIQSNPESVLAKLPVICEGATEQGFATKLFEVKFGKEYLTRGVFFVDAGGHYQSLPICKSLISAGFPVAAIVDDEGKKSGSWQQIGARINLLRWESGMTLEKAILSAMPDELLQKVIMWPEEIEGRAAVHNVAELRKALGVENKSTTVEELFSAVGRATFLAGLLDIVCPPPVGGKRPKGWFKSFEGGYLLATKLISVIPRPAVWQLIDLFLAKAEASTSI